MKPPKNRNAFPGDPQVYWDEPTDDYSDLQELQDEEKRYDRK